MFLHTSADTAACVQRQTVDLFIEVKLAKLALYSANSSTEHYGRRRQHSSKIHTMTCNEANTITVT